MKKIQNKRFDTPQDIRIKVAIDLTDKGEEYFRAGNHDIALQSFLKASEIFPEYARAKNNIGVIFVYKLEIDKAFQYFSEAFELDPEDPNIVFNYGKIYERLSKFDHAKTVYQSYLNKKHDFPIANALSILIQNVSLNQFESKNIRTIEMNQVVFVADIPDSRVIKLAYGLKQLGWNVTLLHGQDPGYNLEKYFAKVQQYKNTQEALNLIASYKPLLYHVFASWNYFIPAMLINQKLGKIVFDNYDVMAGMVKEDFLKKHYPKNLELERFCLENADGLCCRSLEMQYAKRHLGYQYKGKRIFLLDCCWSSGTTVNLHSVSKMNDALHLAYCGNISTQKNAPFNYHYEVSVLLSKNHIHYHIYPSMIGKSQILKSNILKYVIEQGGDPSYIHIHEMIPPDELITELSAYHYGLHLMWPTGDLGKFPYYLRGFDYGTTNKIFDYIDAGLPVLIHKGKIQRFLVLRYGNGKVVENLSDLIMLNIPKPTVVPHAYQLIPNTQRLIDFYKQI